MAYQQLSSSIQKFNQRPFRRWIDVKSSHQNLSNQEFKVMSYNILAQDLLEIHRYLYDYHDPRAINWPHRYELIIHEILDCKPDILCLQEVQQNHLEHFKIGLKSLNYKTLYKKRTGKKTDGCAVFYNDLLFNLEDYHFLEFEQPGIEVLSFENVAIIAKFSLKMDQNISFLCSTTHLHHNPERQDVRLSQIQLLLAELGRMSADNCPIIFTGDLNCMPFSAPFELLIQGKLKYENLTKHALTVNYFNDNINGKTLLPTSVGISDNCRHVVKHSDEILKDPALSLKSESNNFQTGTLCHNLNFHSVYNPVKNIASTHQDEWVLVDYILYSSTKENHHSKLSLKSFMRLPSPSECIKIGRIPNFMVGSDHLSLAAQFVITPNN